MTDLISRFAERSDLHQSPEYANILREIGWSVDGAPGSQIFYRSLGPLAIAKFQRSKIVDLDRLKHFRKSHHTLTFYLEPAFDHPYLPGLPTEPFAHSKSSLLDLSATEKTLLSSFTQKTRYNITRNLKQAQLHLLSLPLSKLSVEHTSDFYSLHEAWHNRKKVYGYPTSLLRAVFKSYARRGTLHLAYHNQTPVGTILNLYHQGVATYYAAFATSLGFNLYAPTLLAWQSLLTAQENDCDIYDFGGIYDPRYPKMYKDWEGFTRFKAGFNPEVITYPETRLHLFW